MFEHFEHKADIGIRGKGNTLNQAFEECALALTAIMAEPSSIMLKKSHIIELNATDHGALLVSFLNELLFIKDKKKMIYAKFRIKLGKENIVNETGKVNEMVTLKATMFGEKINYNKHSIKVDPKAATYSELFAGEKNGQFIAQCIIDV
ncbi:MAG: archease [archaeon]|jgi:SHS2 domain-containing protein